MANTKEAVIAIYQYAYGPVWKEHLLGHIQKFKRMKTNQNPKPKAHTASELMPPELQNYMAYADKAKAVERDEVLKLINKEGQMTQHVYGKKESAARFEYQQKRTDENLKKWKKARERLYRRLLILKKIQDILQNAYGYQMSLFEMQDDLDIDLDET